MLNKILLYAGYLITLLGFILIFLKLRPLMRKSARQKLVLTPDKNFIEAVKIATLHGEVSSRLLARRLKLKKSDADELILKLYEKHIITPANDRGVSELIN